MSKVELDWNRKLCDVRARLFDEPETSSSEGDSGVALFFPFGSFTGSCIVSGALFARPLRRVLRGVIVRFWWQNEEHRKKWMTNRLRVDSSVKTSFALPFPEAGSRVRLLLVRVPREDSAGSAEEEERSADRSRSLS